MVRFCAALRAFSSGLSFLRPDPNAPILLVEEVVTGVRKCSETKKKMGGEEKKTRIPFYDCINCSVYLISTLSDLRPRYALHHVMYHSLYCILGAWLPMISSTGD